MESKLKQYRNAIKAGDLEEVQNIYNNILADVKSTMTDQEIINLFEPLLSELYDEYKIKSFPFARAVHYGHSDICEWMNNMFESNITENCFHDSKYINMDNVCKLGNLDFLTWFDDSFYYEYDINSAFMSALKNDQFEIADYLLEKHNVSIIKNNSAKLLKKIENNKLSGAAIEYCRMKIVCEDLSDAEVLKFALNQINKPKKSASH